MCGERLLERRRRFCEVSPCSRDQPSAACACRERPGSVEPSPERLERGRFALPAVEIPDTDAGLDRIGGMAREAWVDPAVICCELRRATEPALGANCVADGEPEESQDLQVPNDQADV